MLYFDICFIAVVWTEPTISLRYAYIMNNFMPVNLTLRRNGQIPWKIQTIKVHLRIDNWIALYQLNKLNLLLKNLPKKETLLNLLVNFTTFKEEYKFYKYSFRKLKRGVVFFNLFEVEINVIPKLQTFLEKETIDSETQMKTL